MQERENVIGERIRQRLTELDRGPNWLAHRLRRHPTTVATWLRGRSTPPVPELERIALVLHRTPGWLLGESEATEVRDDLVAVS